MKSTPAVALAVVSSAALIAFLFEQPGSHRVFAASPAQAQSQPVKIGQQPQQESSSSGQGQQPNKGLVITLNGKPMTPDELLQLEASGILDQVKDLQAQLKTDETTIHTLQTSLQSLQTQFNNHSHKVTVTWPGHPCTFLNQYMITRAGDGKQVQLGLWAESPGPCKNPAWSQEQLPMSTPVQGAQADKILGSAP